MTNKSNHRFNVTVVGGGSSAYSVIAFLSGAGHTINLLTQKPAKWNKDIELHYQSPEGEIIELYQGKLNKISSNTVEVIPDSDVIILCLPVAQYRNSLNNLAPYIDKNKKVYVGTIYGQAGFNWMVDEIKDKFSLTKIVTFASGLIPWICRTKEYGKIGINYGCKALNIAATEPKDEFDFLNKTLFNDLCFKWFNKGEYHQSENFLSLTLSVDNQIIHTSRLYGLFLRYGGVWKSKNEVPYFYKDYDELSANLLQELDDDYSKIRNAIIAKYPNKDFSYMLNYLELERLSYSSTSSDILESFLNSVTLAAIGTPIAQDVDNNWVLDKNFRFFTDDIYYGLCIAKWMAEKLQISTPLIDNILEWAQQLLNVEIIKDGKLIMESKALNEKFGSGIPSVYGYQSIDDLIEE